MYKFRNLYAWFTRDRIDLSERKIKEEELYLNNLYEKNRTELQGQKQSDVTRSFLQYKCQMKLLSPGKKVLLNVSSIIISPVFILFALINKCKNSDLVPNKKQVAIINGDIDDIHDDFILNSLKNRFNIIRCKNNNQFSLSYESLLWLIKITFTYILSPFFILRLTIKIAQYDHIIHQYRYPKAIITASEYSFCSSVLTSYLHNRGILHINIMHGEKFFLIRDSFFRFSECYVWDNHYLELFKKLKAAPEQFIIERPPKHEKIIEMGKDGQRVNNVIKFYWASEHEKAELAYLSKHMERLSQQGFKIIIRYHPLHREYFFNNITPFFKKFEYENPNKTDLYQSLAQTEYILGTYTTVLYEGILMNKKIIINDYNYPHLKERQYIVVNYNHYKLSEFSMNT